MSTTTRERTITEQAADFPTFRAFLAAKFAYGELSDLSSHGAAPGWQYLTYTRDCAELHDAYESELWDLLTDQAESAGEGNTLAFMSTLGRADMAFSADGLKNLIVWFAAEHYAAELIEDDEAFPRCDDCREHFAAASPDGECINGDSAEFRGQEGYCLTCAAAND